MAAELRHDSPGIVLRIIQCRALRLRGWVCRLAATGRELRARGRLRSRWRLGSTWGTLGLRSPPSRSGYCPVRPRSRLRRERNHPAADLLLKHKPGDRSEELSVESVPARSARGGAVSPDATPRALRAHPRDELQTD